MGSRVAALGMVEIEFDVALDKGDLQLPDIFTGSKILFLAKVIEFWNLGKQIITVRTRTLIAIFPKMEFLDFKNLAPIVFDQSP